MARYKTITDIEILDAYIIPALKNRGWRYQDMRQNYVFTEGRMMDCGSAMRHMVGRRVDCMLFGEDNYPVVVIEVIAPSFKLSLKMPWAIEYAKANDVRYAYCCNGVSFLEHDLQTGVERLLLLEQFPTKQEMLSNKKFTPYYKSDNIPDPQYYQRVAINRTCEAVEDGRKRALLVMAAGTGKPYTVFQIISRLMRSGTAKRVLYLVDDNDIINGFNRSYGDVLGSDVIVSGFARWALQPYANCKDGHQLYEQYPANHFDLVVINVTRNKDIAIIKRIIRLLEHFSEAVQICVTDSPWTVDIDNFRAYFGDPIYKYQYDQGVEDGFLKPYSVVKIRANDSTIGDEDSPPIASDDYDPRQQHGRSNSPKEKPEWYDSAVRRVVDGMMSKYGEEEVLDIESLDVLHCNPFLSAGLYGHTAAFSNAAEYDQKVRELKKKFCLST